MDIYRVDWAKRANWEMAGICRYNSRQYSSYRARMYEYFIRSTVGEKLSSMPQKYRLADDPLLAAMGYHRMNVKPYAVFFSIHEEEKIVMVERIIHSKRDLSRILRGGR